MVSIQQLLENLHHLNDPHIEYSLLRSCFSLPKFGYSLRTVDTSQHQEVMQTFDTAVRSALEAILGAPLSPPQWDQASLPISMGGLGLRRAEVHGPGSYLASVGSTAELVEEIRCEEEPSEHKVDKSLEALNCQLGDPLTKEGVRVMTQRQISGLVDTEAASRLKQATSEVRDKARLNCLAREGAGDWLTAIPSKVLGLHLRRREFITAVKYRLGAPIFQEEGECPVPRCKAVNDVFGDHAISCGYGGERIAKHNHVRDAFYQTAVQASLGPSREPDGLLPGSDERPADLFIPFWHKGKDAAIDFTVVNPLQAALVTKVAAEGKAGVLKAHNDKIRKYFTRCEAEGIAFLPIAVDTFGGFHEEGLATLSKLGQQLARGVGKEEAEVVWHLRQRVGVLLIRDNVAMLTSRCPSQPSSEVDGIIE